MYHVNTKFAYGEREKTTFFIDVAKPSTIDTVGTIVYFMPSFFLRFFYFIFYLAK